jgi:superfamily II DNA or RNA helicase
MDCIFDDFNSGTKTTILIAPTGLGKCQSPDTPILMYDGSIKRADQVVAGDRLMGPDSAPRNVMSTVRGREEMFKMTPVKGVSYSFNRSHILSLRVSGGRMEYNGLKIDDQEILDISINDYLKASNTQKHRLKWTRVGVDFINTPVEYDPYFVGIYLAEGTAGNNSITNPDKEIRDYISGNFNVMRTNGVGGITMFLKSDGRKFGTAGDIGSLRLELCSNHERHIPDRYKINDTKNRLRLLAGLLDGDGYNAANNCYEIVSKHKRLADDIVYLCRSLGLAAYVSKKMATIKERNFSGLYYRVSISGDLSHVPFKLERRKSTARAQIKSVLNTGFSLRSEGVGDYCGFVIDGDRRYLLGDFSVTHNTTIMGGIAKHYMSKMPNEIVLIISHLGLLITQSGNSFKKFWSINTDVLQGPRIPRKNSRCVLSTVQSSSVKSKIDRWYAKLPHGIKVGLILVDEGHRNSGVAQVDRILEDFFPDAKVVSFTGSPFKDNKDMTHLYEKVSFSISLQEVISIGLLVRPVIHGMTIDKKNLEEVMEKIISSIAITHNRDKSIVFMKSINDAEIMTTALKEMGINAASITSRTPQDLRDKTLIAFTNNHTDSHQVLVTVDVLSVGFDAPAVKAIYMPYGTNSVSQYLQRIGRGLRTFPGKTHCDIYIGGSDPIIEQGKWERIQKKALEAGAKDKPELQDEVLDELDFDDIEPVASEPEDVYTIEIKNVQAKFRREGMKNLAEMVGERSFPQEFLDHLVAVDTTTKVKTKKEATKKQKELIAERGFDATTLTKTEAGITIDAIAAKEGWTVKPKRIVPTGMYKGKEANDVPHAYRAMVKKKGKYYNEELAKFFKGK